MQKLRSIQVLRGIAALAVVVLHCSQDLRGPAGNEAYGAFGVDLFFVISGFIMANVAIGRGPCEFMRDRLWRIYPLWWVLVSPWLFILSASPTVFASSLTLWPVYANGFNVPILQVGWTLSFELLFYVGMTLAIATRAAVPLAIYAACLVAALARSSPLLDFIGNPMTLEFLLGVIVARLPRHRSFGMFIVVGVALFAMTPADIGSAKATLLALDSALWRAMLWGLPAALIVWGALSLEGLFEHRLFDMPVAIGDASYSIYLFHPLAAYGLGLAWPVRLIAAVIGGAVMHVQVERRIIAARRRYPALAPAIWMSRVKGA